jgi:hypothetical protein
MAHDQRILKHEEQIEDLKTQILPWISTLPRPATPALTPSFGPLAGSRVVSTGISVAQPYIDTKMAEFGAEVIHVVTTHACMPGGPPVRHWQCRTV